jgi:hypothetical protein
MNEARSAQCFGSKTSMVRNLLSAESSEDWLKRRNSSRLENCEALAWGWRGQEVRRFLTTDYWPEEEVRSRNRKIRRGGIGRGSTFIGLGRVQNFLLGSFMAFSRLFSQILTFVWIIYLRTTQGTQPAFSGMTGHSLLFGQIIGVYSENDMKHCVMKCSLLTLQQVVRVVTIVPVRVN